MSNQTIITANGAELCVETFGEPKDPTILLIMGATASMDWWPEEFCRRLAARGRHVIRYDHRDTGQSTTYPPGAPGYTGADLDRDAVGVLDALSIPRAHLVGMSMGGGIAQYVAAEYPERVASLTLICTMSVGRGGPESEASSSSDEEHESSEETTPEPDWSDREAVADYLFEDVRQYQGTVRSDERDVRALIARVIDRTKNIESSVTNHWVLEDGDLPEVSIDRIDVPTLVIHGIEDRLIPYRFGEALAAEIVGARFITLNGVGHGELPPPTWDSAISAIVDITSG